VTHPGDPTPMPVPLIARVVKRRCSADLWVVFLLAVAAGVVAFLWETNDFAPPMLGGATGETGSFPLLGVLVPPDRCGSGADRIRRQVLASID